MRKSVIISIVYPPTTPAFSHPSFPEVVYKVRIKCSLTYCIKRILYLCSANNRINFMGYIQPFDRNQLTLPESLDSYISCENPVRLIDVFVDQFIKLHPDFSSYKGNSPTGRSAYSFGTLLKLYVYGYLNSISSSRKLERETLRNMELIWLLGNLHPDHKTIADFRSKQTSGIHECCLDFRRFLVSSGYISGKLVAVDGSKIKANTNRDGLTLDGINRQLALLDTRLEKYLHQLNENDLVETAQEQLSELSDELGVESSLLEKIARLSQQVEELQAEKQRMLDEGSQRSFPSDREARLMKTRNGFLPAYNVQSVVDSQHHLIGAMQVTDHPNDFEDLQPSIHAMQEDLQVEVAQAVADTGYANEEQILALEEEGKVIAVPFNEGDHSPKEDREHGIFFTYDADNDYYICSQEKILPIKDRQVRKHGKLYRKYQGRDCKGCPLIKFCTTSKKGRIIYRRADAEPIRQYMKKCKGMKYKALIRLRKALVEHPFGTLKYWMGQIPLLLRGKEKVQAEIDLYATCYNLKRVTNIQSIQVLLQQVHYWGIKYT